MRKRGAKIKHNLAVLPNGFRRDVRWELPLRSVLLSMNELGHLNESHLYDLWVLAEMCKRVGGKGHILVHADAIDRLIGQVNDSKGEVSDALAVSIEASCMVLLEYVKSVSNYAIGKAAIQGMKGK